MANELITKELPTEEEIAENKRQELRESLPRIDRVRVKDNHKGKGYLGFTFS